MFSNEGVYITAFGEINMIDQTMNGEKIPRDVVARGRRLANYGLYASAWDYAAEWMYKKCSAK